MYQNLILNQVNIEYAMIMKRLLLSKYNTFNLISFK
jgi:hypothetical protein